MNSKSFKLWSDAREFCDRMSNLYCNITIKTNGSSDRPYVVIYG